MIVVAGGLQWMKGPGSCVDHLMHWCRAMLALLSPVLWPCWARGKSATDSDLAAVLAFEETAIDEEVHLTEADGEIHRARLRYLFHLNQK